MLYNTTLTPSYGKAECGNEHFMPRYPVRLTTTRELNLGDVGVVVPLEVKRSIAEFGQAALRAWRNYRGLTVQTLQRRSGLHIATLAMLDSGEVALCEWTAEILAGPLEVEPLHLLKAELLVTAWSSSHPPVGGRRRFEELSDLPYHRRTA